MTVHGDQWVQIPSYPGYEVSDSGCVRSRRTGKLLSLSTKRGKHPYQRAHLCQEGKARYVLVHRLVLESFVGPCPDGMQALHLDNNPRNNRLDNLRWGTAKENHSTIDRRGTANGRCKLTPKKVSDIRASKEQHSTLSTRFGVSATTIQNIRNRRLWKHL
jgi:hypothetical protein